MTTDYDIDPNTQTVAAAWASSPLGQPDHHVGFFTEPGEAANPVADAPRPVVRHAVAAFAVAGIAVGAALGAMFFVDFTPDQQTVVIPATTPPAPAVIVRPSVQTPAPADTGQAAPAVPMAPAPAAAGTPPAGTAAEPTEIVDGVAPADPTSAPDAPSADAPVEPDPQPPAEPEPQPPVDPNPQPPVPDDLDIALPEPQPDPGPPVFEPDLSDAPPPGPKPKPMPDFEIAAGPGS